MKNLIKKILRESDEFDWVKSIKPKTEDFFIPGQTYYMYRTLDPSSTEPYVFIRYEINNFYGENLLVFDNGDYTVEYIEAALDYKGLTLFDLLPDNNLNESTDDFDWVREVDPNTPVDFINAVKGKKYRVEVDEVLLDALLSCGSSETIYFYAKEVEVINIDYNISYSEIYCDSENHDKVISLHLNFDLDEMGEANFWVTDDMVTLYEMYDELNEKYLILQKENEQLKNKLHKPKECYLNLPKIENTNLEDIKMFEELFKQ